MKYTWRRTPQLWAIRETQAYYARMAAKGWMLQERGLHFDRYIRCEPQELQFWLEFTKRDEDIPEEKLQLYEDCGWKLAAEQANVHVFAAPADESIPQPYDIDDPAQDAMMQQLQKFYRSDLLSFFITSPLLAISVIAWGFAPLHEVLAGWWWAMFWLFGLLGTTWNSIYGFIQLRRLRKRLRAGEWPTAKRHRAFKGIKYGLTLLSLLCLVVGFVELVVSYDSRYPLPERSDGVYLVPSEALGLERTPLEDSFLGKLSPSQTNMVDVSYALPFYTLYEAMEVLDDDGLSVWQDVYVLRFPSLAPRLAQSLMEDGTFADPEYYVPVEIEGLDAAWYVPTGMEYVARKGNLVVYGTVTGDKDDDSAALLPLLEAIAALWNE